MLKKPVHGMDTTAELIRHLSALQEGYLNQFLQRELSPKHQPL